MTEQELQEIERRLDDPQIGREAEHYDQVTDDVRALIAEVRRLRDKEMQQCPTCKAWVRNKPILGTLHICD